MDVHRTDLINQHEASKTAPRNAVISGASGGLGPVIARHFAEQGCALLLPVRGDPAEVEAAFPGAQVVSADLTKADDAQRVAEMAGASWGTTDAVINVAGGFTAGSALTLDAATLERQLDLNLRTAVNLTTAFLPGMVDAGRGVVLGVSAGAAGGARNVPAYAASKAALEAYLRSVRAEVEPHGLGVSILIPQGTLDTPANRSAMPDVDPASWISLAAVADAAWFLATRAPGGRTAELAIHV